MIIMNAVFHSIIQIFLQGHSLFLVINVIPILGNFNCLHGNIHEMMPGVGEMGGGMSIMRTVDAAGMIRISLWCDNGIAGGGR